MRYPLKMTANLAKYVAGQRFRGTKKFPMVMMLEPLHACNLTCTGCGRIREYESSITERLPLDECLWAVDECGAPIVAIAGGEPLLHKEMPEITRRILAKGKFIYLCTNALLLEKKIDQYKPHKNFCWDIHLDGDKQMHDKSVDQEGVYERAVDAIKLAKSKGFRVSINCTLFEGADPDRVAAFFDTIADLNIDGVMTSPGYAYERAPDQEHFLNRTRTKELFRAIFRRGEESKKRGKNWKFNQSPLFLDFLAGNQTYACTPWGNPTRNVFGWQRPCYLLGEGYAKTYKELMDSTDWDKYGVGNYEKCADCMVHSGYEATAVVDSVKRPWKAAKVALRGVKTEGEMAPEINLDHQRPAQYVFSGHVEKAMERLAVNGD